VLTMLFALPALLAASINLELTVPAVRGLAAEAARNYNDAQRAYRQLEEIDMVARSMLPGLSSGSFLMERQYAVLGTLYGPLGMRSMPPISETFARVPKSLRKLSQQYNAFYGIVNNLQGLPGPAEGEDENEYFLAALEILRDADGPGQANKPYYEAIALLNTIGDPAQKQANLARIATLKADPASEPWMYEEAEFYYAREDADYAALAALCDAHLERNRQDHTYMAIRVKSMFLAGRAEEALAAADAYAKYAEVRDSVWLVKAEIYYRQGEYGKAAALCDEVIGNRDFSAPLASQEDADAALPALEAVSIKGAALLLQGKNQEANDLLVGVWEGIRNNGMGLTAQYAYTMLISHIAAKDDSGAKALIETLQNEYGVATLPQAITDLQEGKTTVEKIFTEGWGGFDA